MAASHDRPARQSVAHARVWIARPLKRALRLPGTECGEGVPACSRVPTSPSTRIVNDLMRGALLSVPLEDASQEICALRAWALSGRLRVAQIVAGTTDSSWRTLSG